MTNPFQEWEESIQKALLEIQSMAQDVKDLQGTADLIEANLSQLDEESQTTRETARLLVLVVTQLVKKSQDHDRGIQELTALMRDSVNLHVGMLDVVKELRADVNVAKRELTGR